MPKSQVQLLFSNLDQFKLDSSDNVPNQVEEDSLHSTNSNSTSYKDEVPETPPDLLPTDTENSNGSSSNSKASGASHSTDEEKSSLGMKHIDDAYLTEKEKLLKSLAIQFPSIDLMVVQDALLRFNWDESETLQFLKEKKHTKSPISLSAHLQKFKRRKEHCDSSDDEEPTTTTASVKPPAKRQKKEEMPVLSDDENEYQQDSNEDYDSDEGTYRNAFGQPMRVNMLKFIQQATLQELMGVSGCSKKKAELILENRPYGSWHQLVSKFDKIKTLSGDFLVNIKEFVQTRQVIVKLMNHCQEISERIGKQVSDLADNQHILQQPSNLSTNMKLTPYQMLGLNWLALLHDNNINCILADEMGLGKTIQAIAFLAYLKSVNIRKPHLIIVPSSTMDNWLRELNVWYPTANVLCYYGSPDERKEIRFQIYNKEIERFDIMVSTYNQISSMAEDRNFLKKLEFYYVIFDEGHMLKNMKSNRYQNMVRIKGKHRILLTGTPLQNNLVELMSLLIFIMPNLFTNKIDQVKLMFSGGKTKDSKIKFEQKRVEHAKHIMKPFILRRLKSEVLKQLPSKIEEVRFCPMTDTQEEHYKKVVAKISKEYRELEEKNHAGGLMKLRKAANHRLLFRNHFTLDILKKMSHLMLKESTHKTADPDLILEDMEVLSDFDLHKLCLKYPSIEQFKLSDDLILNSGKFGLLDDLLPEFKEKKNKVLIFSQFTMVLDILEAYCNIREHKFIRLDGSTRVQDRQDLMDDYTNDPELFVFLLSTRAGGLGINLTAANVVIIHDLDFNPYNDKQAEDRSHRVGQTKDVLVFRLISKDTIEEGMHACALEKLKLERNITNDEEDEDGESTADVKKLLKNALQIS